jgi:hypothetical protein
MLLPPAPSTGAGGSAPSARPRVSGPPAVYSHLADNHPVTAVDRMEETTTWLS